MKPSSVLLLLFGLLASTALFAQSGGKDYLNFAPNGYVDSFKKTAPDGSFLEISEKRLNGDGSRVPIKVVCSNGEILEAFFFWAPSGNYILEKFYVEHVEKAQSFDMAINDFMLLVSKEGEDSFDLPYEAMCSQPDGLVLFYRGKKPETFCVDCFKMPLKEKGDYLICAVNKEYNIRYFDSAHLTDNLFGQIIEVQRHYNDFDVLITNGTAKVQYKDGSSFSGVISVDDGDVADWHFWANYDKEPIIHHITGILRSKNGDFKILLDGEYNELETLREKQQTTPGRRWQTIPRTIRNIDSLPRESHKFDGDWKAVYRPDWSDNNLTVIIHLSGENASFEKTRRSPGDPKEEKMAWDHSGDSIVASIEGYQFEGKLVNGKIVGQYYVNKKAYNLSFSKFGAGQTQTSDNYKISKGLGVVIY